jgi:hypothetical protein
MAGTIAMLSLLILAFIFTGIGLSKHSTHKREQKRAALRSRMNTVVYCNGRNKSTDELPTNFIATIRTKSVVSDDRKKITQLNKPTVLNFLRKIKEFSKTVMVKFKSIFKLNNRQQNRVKILTKTQHEKGDYYNVTIEKR